MLAAATGVEALLILDGDEPALVITDMRMPLMDGWQLAAELRARYADRVPLLVMTAAVDATQRAGEVGAAGTISKPFDLDDLVRAVHHLIGPAEPASHVDGQQESRGA